ncbi:MAG: FAD-dependent oxidoreductase [Anaerocolumna sp.]
MDYIIRSEKKVTVRNYDVVVCGGGTGGVLAAIAAARGGAKTAVIESKGYVGGIATEGGCGLHSSYNNWKTFHGVEKRMVVRGIPEEMIQRLTQANGASGHNETALNYEYDSDTLCVDVEVYKFVALQMLREEGVDILLNTMMVDAVMEGTRVVGVITESHQGCEAVMGKIFIDSTGYGDLCARAGASYTEPNDYTVANSMGIGGIDIDKYYSFLKDNGALKEFARGPRSGRTNQLIRVDGRWNDISPELGEEVRKLGMHTVTTTLHDNYFMFIKLNFQMPASPTNRDALAQAEFELRRRQFAALELLRKTVPGSANAFITRTSPAITIRRARCITCEYDLSNEEIVNATHFEDDIFSYGFHDEAPHFQIKDGGTYGIPYRAIQVKKIENLFAIGMMITSNHDAHMSTRNTISCMAQGQAAGTAAALCAKKNLTNVRDLSYDELYGALKLGNVWFDAEVPY